MIVADKFGPKRPKIESLDEITYRQAFNVGLVQCLSLWPGFSRSGATISGGVLFGMNHRTSRGLHIHHGCSDHGGCKPSIGHEKLGIHLDG